MWNPIRRWLNVGALVPKLELYREFGAADFIHFSSEEEKLMYALHNPAFLKVASLQCDTFSLGRFRMFKDTKEIEDHPLLTLLKQPYFNKGTEEFLWEWMFNLMLGKSFVRATSDNFNRLTPPLLIPIPTYKIREPRALLEKDFAFILTEEEYNRIASKDYKYTTNLGRVLNIPGDEIIATSDLSIDGASRIEALMKIIQNNEKSIDSQNINIKYAGKFMIAGKSDPKNINQLPMNADEKRDIEKKSISRKPVEAIKSMVDIKRYVSDKMFKELGDAYSQTYHQIGSMYNIPKDVLEAFQSSTFENQEQARAAHVAYTLMPKANVFCRNILNYFGLQEYDLRLEYNHLPFMQVFERERISKKKETIEVFNSMVASGIPLTEINEYLGTNFRI